MNEQDFIQLNLEKIAKLDHVDYGQPPIENVMGSMFNNLPDPVIPPMPPVKPMKKEKIRRIYEDDDFIIDLFPENHTVRVSIFKDNHFQDEVFIRKQDYD